MCFFCLFVAGTVFVGAVAEGSLLLRGLFEEERRVTVRTSLEYGFVPVNDVAVRIFRAAVECFAAFRLLHHDLALAARPRTGNTDRLLLDVLALRIIRTRDKLAETPDALHQLRAIDRTLFIERHWRRCGHASLANLSDVPAFGITCASEEWTKASTL